MTKQWKIEPARTEELAQALRLLFRNSPADERDTRVANGLSMVHQGEMEPAGILVARGPSGVRGAIACTPVAGAGGLVWPPQVLAGAEQTALEDLLVQRARAWLRERGVKLVQSLLAPHERCLAEPLVRNGFRHVTQLQYLRHDLNLSVAVLGTAVRGQFQTFAECDRQVFERTLLRSYDETEDCPEVNGVRTIDEIIEGHQSQGLHDPERWWLAWTSRQPIGVVLVTEMHDGEGWELSYLGVVPEARRQGFGRELTLKALCEAKAADAGQLTLSVDARNAPARQLYRSVGFEPFDERAVYLALHQAEASARASDSPR